jgi:glycine oxidase
MSARIMRERRFVLLGAGLMGRLLAHQLSAAGHTVEVFDAHGPDAGGAAARVAAAMLAPWAESAVAPPTVVRMGLHGLQRWPQLLASLAQPVFAQQTGTLVVWHRADEPEARRFERLVSASVQTIEGRPAGIDELRRVDASQIAALEPALQGQFSRGLYLPQEGQLDNRQLLAALLHGAEASGARFHWQTPRQPADFATELAQKGCFLIDCRGLGAAAAWAAPQQLRGVRGEVIRVHAPAVQLSRPVRLMHPHYPLYIAPKENGLFVLGATEIERDDLSPMSVRSALELLSAAYAVHKGFGEGRIVELATQSRPALPDNLPAIRVTGPQSLQINGLYRHGFLVAPALLDAALAWLDSEDAGVAARFGLTIQTA